MNCKSFLVLSGVALLTVNAQSRAGDSGPADRTTLSTFLHDSIVKIIDRNGDCFVSDIDVALTFEEVLRERYGDDFNVGDQDGDGVSSAADVFVAIRKMLVGAFGKTSAQDGTVSVQDLLVVVDGVVAHDQNADVNLDGAENVLDITDTYAQIGTVVDSRDVSIMTDQLFGYIGSIRERGASSFKAVGCASGTHLTGLSNTWPPSHPGWWPDNHMSGVSRSYDQPRWPPANHSTASTSSQPNPPAHQTATSKAWPPNHDLGISTSWPPTWPPYDHNLLASSVNSPPQTPYHMSNLSATWPTGHWSDISNGWGPNHDIAISRTWWPSHTTVDSKAHVIPPLHTVHASGTWVHQASLSQASWPPNHFPGVSDGWGPAHSIALSSAYPPGHVGAASTTWPGPQPTWPPSHTASVSRSWGEPAPGSWPVFPPGHSWFATFRDVVSPVVPRIPWSSAANQ